MMAASRPQRPRGLLGLSCIAACLLLSCGGQDSADGGDAGTALAADYGAAEEEEDAVAATAPQPPSPSTSEEPIPDKVGAEVHLSKAERSAMKKLECGMCRAILSEMHTEVTKHRMTAKGWGSESHVWETSNAICLALLQKYKLDLSAPKLERKGPDEDDEMMGMGANPADAMRAMLVLKMGCQRWVEDYGGDTSGYIFKIVRDGLNSAEGAAQDFCTRRVSLCGKGKQEKRHEAKEQERKRMKIREAMVKKQEDEEAAQKQKDPFSSLPEDSKFGLQRMLEMARDDPLHYMEDEGKERVRRARAELRCPVCSTAVEEVHREVSRLPKSMRSEHDILPLFEGVCEGGRDLSVPSYFGVEPPPLPPPWTDRVRPHVAKGSKTYALKAFSKKAAKARKKWRALTLEGKHKPPPAGESEGDMMLTLTCKDILEPERMTEVLYEQLAQCGDAGPSCDAAAAAAASFCKDAAGATCGAARGAHGAAAAGEGAKQEL